MCRRMKLSALLLVVVFTFGMAVTPVPASEEGQRDYRGGDVVFDALLLRPLGLVATVFGTGAFVVSLPFTIVSGDVEKAGSKLIADPLRYTFKRPLGDF